MVINGFRLSFNRSHAFRSVNEGLGNKNDQGGNQEDTDTQGTGALMQWKHFLGYSNLHESSQSGGAWTHQTHTHTQTHVHTHRPVCGCATFGLLENRVLVTTVSLILLYLMFHPLPVFLSVTHTHTHTHTHAECQWSGSKGDLCSFGRDMEA